MFPVSRYAVFGLTPSVSLFQTQLQRKDSPTYYM